MKTSSIAKLLGISTQKVTEAFIPEDLDDIRNYEDALSALRESPEGSMRERCAVESMLRHCYTIELICDALKAVNGHDIAEVLVVKKGLSHCNTLQDTIDLHLLTRPLSHAEILVKEKWDEMALAHMRKAQDSEEIQEIYPQTRATAYARLVAVQKLSEMPEVE